VKYRVKVLESCSEQTARIARAGWLGAAASVALGVCIVGTAFGSEEDSVEIEDVGSEEFVAAGEQTTGAVCTQCHGWDMIFGGPRQTPDQWDFIVSDMLSRGAQATSEQASLIKRYLKWTWGAVWINSATPQDLVQVIGLPEEDAEAVIAWREEHGKFTDLEGLKEVPGIDPSAIDAQADAIMFN
jgi:competence protein ComEA